MNRVQSIIPGAAWGHEQYHTKGQYRSITQKGRFSFAQLKAVAVSPRGKAWKLCVVRHSRSLRVSSEHSTYIGVYTGVLVLNDMAFDWGRELASVRSQGKPYNYYVMLLLCSARTYMCVCTFVIRLQIMALANSITVFGVYFCTSSYVIYWAYRLGRAPGEELWATKYLSSF